MVDIKRYINKIYILPTNNTVDIYKYSEKMLKHLSYKALSTIEDALIYSKEKVVIHNGNDRISNTSTTEAYRAGLNLNFRKEFYYKIPLKYFVDLGLVNLPKKADTKFIFTLESNMNKLFQSKVKVTPTPHVPNAKILYHDTTYIYYQQISIT